MTDIRSSLGLPRSPAGNGYGGVIPALAELAVNRLHDTYTVQGSGPVKRLTPLPRGTALILYFTDAPTFTNSANLLCPGSVDTVFAAGDAGLVRSQGDGVWRLLKRFPAATKELLAANNLSDVASVAAARTNLGTVGAVRIQKFTSSNTYTPDPNLLYAIIEVVGGGGGGGAVAGNASNAAGAAGGGAGGYSRKVVSAATIGASQSVTIGAAGTAASAGNNSGGNGGQTSVGTLCVANGGVGGGGTNSFASPVPGAGGSPGTGDIAAPGAPGAASWAGAASIVNSVVSGGGGSGPFGEGGLSVFANAGVTAGAAASGYGGGGSGGAEHASGSNAAGGAGTAGFVFITEFCSQ